jgi:hypothetical protein
MLYHCLPHASNMLVSIAAAWPDVLRKYPGNEQPLLDTIELLIMQTMNNAKVCDMYISNITGNSFVTVRQLLTPFVRMDTEPHAR